MVDAADRHRGRCRGGADRLDRRRREQREIPASGVRPCSSAIDSSRRHGAPRRRRTARGDLRELGTAAQPHASKACVAVLAGGKFYVVDTGPESVENLVQWGIPLRTHRRRHDHALPFGPIGDLGELNLQSWVQGRPMPLPVYGGPGIDQVVADSTRPIASTRATARRTTGAESFRRTTWPLVAHPVEPGGEAHRATATVHLTDGDMKVTAIEVDHGPVGPPLPIGSIQGSVGRDQRRRATVSAAGRRCRRCRHPRHRGVGGPMIETLERTAAAAAAIASPAIMHDIQGYHISPTEVAELSNQAHVRLLVFYHLLPAPDNALTRACSRRVFERRAMGSGTWPRMEVCTRCRSAARKCA